MDKHFTYLIILAAAFAGPLLLSFDKRVHFYTKWKFAIVGAVLPALFYIVWDTWFTQMHVWSFNPICVLEFRMMNLPVEEILFFFVIPFCCLFIYECVRTYFPRLQSGVVSESILFAIGFAALVIAMIFRNREYTFYTGIFSAAFVFVMFLMRRQLLFFNSAAFLVSYLIILLPFLAVNGMLTALPVVIYNNAQNTGVRIFSIPVEDTLYGFLLILMNTAIYEKFRSTIAD